MKRWIKRYSRQIWIGLGVLFIINALLGLTVNKPDGAWIIVHIIALPLWGLILLFKTGIAGKLDNWWEKD